MYWIFYLTLWSLVGVSLISKWLLLILCIESGGVELIWVDKKNKRCDRQACNTELLFVLWYSTKEIWCTSKLFVSLYLEVLNCRTQLAVIWFQYVEHKFCVYWIVYLALWSLYVELFGVENKNRWWYFIHLNFSELRGELRWWKVSAIEADMA